MNDYVAVRTNGTQIIDRINLISFADLRERLQMMHMNDVSPNFAIRFFKIKTADDTSGFIAFYTLISCISVSFITIDVYLFSCAFIEVFSDLSIYFFWGD